MPEIEKGYRYKVTNEYDARMERLIEKYSELEHLDTSFILVVLKEKGPKKPVFGKVSKIPERWRDIIEQMTGTYKSFVLELYADQLEAFGEEESKLVALLYRELRRIDFEFNVGTPDIVEWEQLYRGFGRDWAAPASTIPNLLDDGVNWNVILGPNKPKGV